MSEVAQHVSLRAEERCGGGQDAEDSDDKEDDAHRQGKFFFKCARSCVLVDVAELVRNQRERSTHAPPSSMIGDAASHEGAG